MKKNIYENYHVEINIPEPQRVRKYNMKTEKFEDCTEHQGFLAAGKELISDIKRHCDFNGAIDINFDVKEVCEFCGYEWEEDETGNPVCCDKAIEEWLAERVKP